MFQKIAACFGVSILTAAHASPPVPPGEVPLRELARTTTAPVIDGVLDDAVWTDATLIDDLAQVEPIEAAEPSERTEVRLLHDRDTMYVAIQAFDADPDAIVATQMRRDADLDADDHVRILIDPYFDRRNGFLFEINAVGAKRDGLIESNTRIRTDWDGIWQGKATMTAEGWTAEIAIPFKTISFDPATSQWGFNVERFIRRRNEVVRWAAARQNRQFNAVVDAGVLNGIHDIDQGIGLDFKPYGLVGYRNDRDSSDDGFEVDGGFDLFYKVTPAMTAAITVNTDFAETEVDTRRVNLTRFPLFFPEKRDFFLQDAGIFDFGGIRRNPLPFFSRRIGLGPSGQVIDILAGAKLTGRAGDWNVGVLDVQTRSSGTLDARNLFVGRVSRNILEESTVGAIVTHGNPRGEEDNWLAGADINFRDSSLPGGKTVSGSAWFQQTDTEGMNGDQLAWGARVGWPNDRISWELGFSHIGAEYNPALGFVSRRGIREYFGNWRYRWRPETWIRTIDVGVFGMMITDTDDELETTRLNFNLLEIETNDGDQLELEYTLQREILADGFEIADGVMIPAGDRSWGRYGVGFESSEGRPVGIAARYEGGDFWTGTRNDFEFGVEWRASRHFLLETSVEVNDVNLPEGDFTVHLGRVRLDLQFTPDVTWSTFVQYDNVSESMGVNSRFSWIVQPGNELFFVVNQGYDVDGLDRIRPTVTDVSTKVGWTFRF